MSEARVESNVYITPAGLRVHAIPATLRRYAPAQSLTAKKRVAAYARVSTDEEEQLNSYEAQVDYYTSHIKANPEWTFVEVYADEGISATNTKKRVNFNRMIADAKSGKIDMIITKSVSRFARNTVDTLTIIRDLKARGVGVIFEKDETLISCIWAFSFDKAQYLVVLCCALTLHFVACRLVVA